MGQRPTDGRSCLDVQHDPERLASHPPSGDRSYLARYDHASSRLTRLAGRDGYVSWVPRLAPGGGDGAHGHEPRPVERLVRDYECAPLSSLFVTLHGIEIHDHDRPTEAVGQAGQVSASAVRYAASRSSASRRKSGSSAAAAHTRASSASRSRRSSSSTAISTTPSCDRSSPYRPDSSRTVRIVPSERL